MPGTGVSQQPLPRTGMWWETRWKKRSLKVPPPWRRSWAKQDFHRWANKRWGGCLAASLLEAQQPPTNCWDLLFRAVSEGNANQHLVVVSDVKHKSFLMGLAVVVAAGSVALEISISLSEAGCSLCAPPPKSFSFLSQLQPQNWAHFLSLAFVLFKHVFLPCWLSVSVSSALSQGPVFQHASLSKFEDRALRSPRTWLSLSPLLVLSNHQHWDSWSVGWKSRKCHQSHF